LRPVVEEERIGRLYFEEATGSCIVLVSNHAMIEGKEN
jgi:hypothetical protein